MVKASTDDGHADRGGLVSINTGTSTRSGEAVVAAGAQPRAAGGPIAAFISWLDISTGTNTISATSHGAQIASGAGSVVADGATAVNTNSSGAVNITGAPAQPCRTAGGAFSDQMFWASRFFHKTCTDSMSVRGAFSNQMLWASQFPYKTCTDTMSVGGARSVIPDGATAFNTSNAWAFNTTGARPQPWHTAGFKSGCDAIYATDRAQIAAGAGSVIATGAATVNTNYSGSVLSTGAATVETNSAGAVNTTDGLAQLSRTSGGAVFDQMLNPGPFIFEPGTIGIFNFGHGAQIAGPGAIIAAGAASVNTNTAAAVSTYEQISPSAQIAGVEDVIASGAAAVNANNADAVNIYEGVDVSWPTNTMISIVVLGGLGMLGSIKMLRIAGISSKNDAIRFVRAATAEGLSLKRKMHWAARVIHRRRSVPPPTAAPPSTARGTYINQRDIMVRKKDVNDINSGHTDSDNSTDDEEITSQDDTDIMVTDGDNGICNYPIGDEDEDMISGDDDVDTSTGDDGSGSGSDCGSGSDSDSGSSSDDEVHIPAPKYKCVRAPKIEGRLQFDRVCIFANYMEMDLDEVKTMSHKSKGLNVSSNQALYIQDDKIINHEVQIQDGVWEEVLC